MMEFFCYFVTSRYGSKFEGISRVSYHWVNELNKDIIHYYCGQTSRNPLGGKCIKQSEHEFFLELEHLSSLALRDHSPSFGGL